MALRCVNSVAGKKRKVQQKGDKELLAKGRKRPAGESTESVRAPDVVGVGHARLPGELG